jgi:hypothetical protein
LRSVLEELRLEAGIAGSELGDRVDSLIGHLDVEA